MLIEAIKSKLNKVRPSGKDRWMACCPAHEDKSRSLMFGDKPHKVSIHCFAGCTVEEITSAMGMRVSDLYKDSLTPINRDRYRYRALQKEMEHVTIVLQMYDSDLRQGNEIDTAKYCKAISERDRITRQMSRLRRKWV